MPTWENELYINSLWMDTTNSALNILKRFDPMSNLWVPATPTTATEVGTYSADTIDTKIGTLKQSGTSDIRPTDVYVGMPFFDTTLGKPIWCHSLGNPNIWVDSTGANV